MHKNTPTMALQKRPQIDTGSSSGVVAFRPLSDRNPEQRVRIESAAERKLQNTHTEHRNP